MTTIYFIFALLGGASLWNMISFYNLRLKVKTKKIEIIKLKQTGWQNYLSISFFGIMTLWGVDIPIKDSRKEYLFYILLLLVIISMVSLLIGSGEYLIINENGIKRDKLMKWDSITEIGRNEYSPTELWFTINNKKNIIDFYSEENINALKSIVKIKTPETYRLYLAEL